MAVTMILDPCFRATCGWQNPILVSLKLGRQKRVSVGESKAYRGRRVFWACRQIAYLRLHSINCDHILAFHMTVSVRDLKTHLSEYLRRVQQGESVEVTSHGKVVAQLVPPAAQEESVIGGLSRMPWIRMGHPGAKLGLDEPIALSGEGPSLTGILLADRE